MNCSHLFFLFGSFGLLHQAAAHSWKAGEKPVFDEALRAHLLAEWNQGHRPSLAGGEIKPVRTASTASVFNVAAAAVASAKNAPAQALPFQSFSKLELKWDKYFLYVGSNGLPDHGMMVGITAWQQQVPLPQAYFGSNAWRVPLHPVPAKEPASIKGRFLRGAIALAVNGIPIFNPQNNRGEVSQEIGELDQWGGHCGRADDYHYHAAPLHLQVQAGKGLPIAYALDGYPIHGLAEPDGSPPGKLDEFNGHETAALGYHYHASTKYPYVNGGFHGEVVEAGGQVDPQPRAQGVRPDTPPLRGAEITGFEATEGSGYKLTYTLSGEKRSITYSLEGDSSYLFKYNNGREGSTTQTYGRQQKGGGRQAAAARQQNVQAPSSNLRPPTRATPLHDSNGDGIVTAVEYAAAEKLRFTTRKDGLSLAEAMEEARAAFAALDKNGNQQLEPAEFPDAGGTPAEKKGAFVLTSPEVEDGGSLPVDYTGDGSGATLPLEWRGAPAGTQSYALVMDHLAPGNEIKSYWTLWDIPAGTTRLPKNVSGVGKTGVGFKGAVGYEPPHSKGPGEKTYVLHVYALSAAPGIKETASKVNREVLLAAIEGKVLASADLHVVYSRGGAEATSPGAQPAAGPASEQRRPWIQMHAKELDADQDGIITLAEITADMQRGAAAYDTNKDGVIIPAEIDAAGDIREGAAFAGFIYRHAVDLDVDNDSRLTKDELTAAVQYVFATADQDQDGKVTAAESESSPNAPLPVPARGVAAAPAQPSAAPRQEGAPGMKKGGGGGGRKGGPDQSGLIKPGIGDTLKLNVYADNWFMLYVNGRLVAVDPIQFTPHNVVSVDFLPEYPMTLAVLAKDNADPKTGLEYGSNIGDGGFILKFSDGTVTNTTWKAKNFFHGPVNSDTRSPQVKQEALPANWWAVEFDDQKWPNAKEYSVEQVDPKQPYFENDFEGAKFIWTDDLALDNTVIFRTKIDKPGWKQRWNTKPDLDVTGAPLK